MQPQESEIGRGFERALQSRGPFGVYMRWYLGRRRPIEVPTVLTQLGEGPFARILDAGCGTGLWLADVYRRGHGQELLAGVDVSELMLGQARQRLAGLVGPDAEVRLEYCSAAEMPFADGSFDAVMANAMVKHLDDERFPAFLAEAMRLLVPGGRLSMWDFGRPLVPLPKTDVGNPALGFEHMRTSEVLVKALSEAGFEDARPYTVKRPWRMPVTFEGAAATRPSAS